MSNKSVMPVWGPYSKKYMGISRVMGELKNKSGLTSADAVRFDFTVHPTVWNSSTPVPNVTVPSSYHLWKCSEDYTFYSYRYELMWKDMVYADVSFSKINDEAYLARVEFVNNTDLSQNTVLNLFSSLEFPNGKEYYMVKNSWGETGAYKGIWYMTKNYVVANTMDYMVNKNAIPKDIRKKLGI